MAGLRWWRDVVAGLRTTKKMMALRGGRRLCSHGCCMKMKNDGGAAIECTRCRDGGGWMRERCATELWWLWRWREGGRWLRRRCCRLVVLSLLVHRRQWCDGDAVVAGEVRRCGGGCHGGGRREEN